MDVNLFDFHGKQLKFEEGERFKLTKREEMI